MQLGRDNGDLERKKQNVLPSCLWQTLPPVTILDLVGLAWTTWMMSRYVWVPMGPEGDGGLSLPQTRAGVAAPLGGGTPPHPCC